MSEHHPDCFVEDYDTHSTLCICRRLRAAEQRVREDDKNTFLRAAYDTGHEDGVKAAREAVAALPHDPDCRSYRGGTCGCPWREYMLAAIDGVKP